MTNQQGLGTGAGVMAAWIPASPARTQSKHITPDSNSSLSILHVHPDCSKPDLCQDRAQDKLVHAVSMVDFDVTGMLDIKRRTD